MIRRIWEILHIPFLRVIWRGRYKACRPAALEGEGWTPTVGGLFCEAAVSRDRIQGAFQ